ncbi:MAG: thioredoxin-dependent thiol peroxidase [Ignavibacteriaceae bacterium]|nr:thioredoxin-dependent thiol peroxidase [Ignavibacteriaceae bacterium]
MLEIGKRASAFSLLNQDSKKVSLKDFAGKQVILYFYPKDLTSGCTQEACDFRDRFDYVKTAKAVLLGISPDSAASHKKFIEKYELPFDLLSDEKKEILMKYGVWKEKSMYGRKYMGVERTTVIIDKEGKIKQIFPKVKVNGHADEVLKALK